MNKIKHYAWAFMAMAFMSACSSEDNILPDGLTPPEARDWQTVNFDMGVDKGSAVSTPTTRAQGELDPQGLPKAQYPENLGLYILKFSSSTQQISAGIALNEEGSGYASTQFVFSVDKENNTVTLAKTEDAAEQTTIAVEDYEDGNIPTVNNQREQFFFSSQREVENCVLPQLDDPDNWLHSDNAYTETGDKLFGSEGYFFRWKDAEKTELGLYNIRAREEGSYTIEEVDQWQTSQLDVRMQRLTSCVSICLMLIDHCDDQGVHHNIEGMGAETSPEDADQLAQTALSSYIAANRGTLDDNYPGAAEQLLAQLEGGSFSFKNIFVWKKIFNNFPVEYNWNGGYNTTSGAQGDLFLCDLDYPSWLDATVNFRHGNNNIYAMTAECDNEPFIPAFGEIDNELSLTLFMGMGKYDPSIDIMEGKPERIVSARIPLTGNNYSVAPNTRTYIYVSFTLKNIVELYYNLYLRNNNVRAAAAAPQMTLSGNQVKTVTKSYYAE